MSTLQAEQTSVKSQQRRRAVYAALVDVFALSNPSVNKLFAVWEHEFSKEPQFLVVRYIARCAMFVSITEEQRFRFRQSMFERLTQSYENLPHYPEETLAIQRPATVNPAAMPNLQKAAPLEPQKAAIPEPQNKAAIPKPTAAATITGAVARSLIGPIRAQYHSKPAVIETIISESFKHSGLPKDEHKSLCMWAIAGAAEDHLLSRYTAAHLQGFIHALYLAACDGLGPVAADKLLSTSIARAQALPAAVEFSPNLLL